MKRLFLFFLLLPFLQVNAQVAPYSIQVAFQNMVGDKTLQLDSSYSNPFGEVFSVTQFKYYVSNFSVTDAETGKEAKIPNTYFLINERDSSSKTISIKLPFSTISAIHFYMGVDSARNVSGVQTDALDPMNGMFWTWNTGYIMAKLEGVSPISKAPGKRITYHIGGFRKADQTVQKISLPLTTPLKLTSSTPTSLTIQADVNKWFSGASDIKIADVNFCMNPGLLAQKIAGNYVSMFKVVE